MKEEFELFKNDLIRNGQSGPCPVWHSTDEVTPRHKRTPQTASSWHYSPRAGGLFHLDDTAEAAHLSDIDDQLRIKISRWIYDENGLGRIPFLTYDEIERIKKQPALRIDERILQLLQCFDTLSSRVSEGLWASGQAQEDVYTPLNLIQAATECANRREREWLTSAAIENGWLEVYEKEPHVSAHARLTPAGVKHIEELAKQTTRSDQAFVAMWFTNEMQKIFDEAVAPAVEEAGYRAYKVDLDHSFDNQITDQIFYQIERSRFLIADFTHDDNGVRGGVYFEAGFAKGLGLPIVWCIREDDVSKLHFDTDHYPHVFWENAEDLKTKLTQKIRAFIGQGPLKKS